MKSKKIWAAGVMITILSFFGFVVENIWLVSTRGYINNRNMLLPFLLGYGLAIMAMYAMFGTPREPLIFFMRPRVKNPVLKTLIFFVCAFVCVSLGEYLLGTFVEKTFNIIWWNYSRLPLSVTKYTSVPTSFAFAAILTVFMRYMFFPLYRAIERINGKVLIVLSCTFMTLMVLDFIHSAIVMAETHEVMQYWRIQFYPSDLP